MLCSDSMLIFYLANLKLISRASLTFLLNSKVVSVIWEEASMMWLGSLMLKMPV
jgi:hypothetical protein